MGFLVPGQSNYADGLTLSQSSGYPIISTIVTDKFNFGTNNQKFMLALTIDADRCDNFIASNFINISVTDDDYITYNTPRSLELNQERPNLQQWGRFRNRALKITTSICIYRKG